MRKTAKYITLLILPIFYLGLFPLQSQAALEPTAIEAPENLQSPSTPGQDTETPKPVLPPEVQGQNQTGQETSFDFLSDDIRIEPTSDSAQEPTEEDANVSSETALDNPLNPDNPSDELPTDIDKSEIFMQAITSKLRKIDILISEHNKITAPGTVVDETARDRIEAEFAQTLKLLTDLTNNREDFKWTPEVEEKILSLLKEMHKHESETPHPNGFTTGYFRKALYAIAPLLGKDKMWAITFELTLDNKPENIISLLMYIQSIWDGNVFVFGDAFGTMEDLMIKWQAACDALIATISNLPKDYKLTPETRKTLELIREDIIKNKFIIKLEEERAKRILGLLKYLLDPWIAQAPAETLQAIA